MSRTRHAMQFRAERHSNARLFFFGLLRKTKNFAEQRNSLDHVQLRRLTDAILIDWLATKSTHPRTPLRLQIFHLARLDPHWPCRDRIQLGQTPCEQQHAV
jgi:hypothetical protein